MVAILLLLLVVALIFSIPAVQTAAAHRLTDYLNTEFDAGIHIDKLQITYDADIEIKGVFIADHHNDTLIAAETLKTSLINIPGLISGKHIDFGDVTAKHMTFRLRRYKTDSIDSFGIFLNKLSRDNPQKKEAPIVKLSHVTIIDSKFSFVDEHSPYPMIVNLSSLNIDASNFIIQGADLSVSINSFVAEDERGVEVKDLQMDFRLFEGHMNFDNFRLKTANSLIEGQIHFSFDGTMTDFENRVQIDAKFDEASVSSTDLHYYYDKFGVGQTLNFNGLMKGTLNDFDLIDFRVNAMQHTQMYGRARFQNVFGNKRFRFDGDFYALETNYTDLIRFLPGILKNTLPEDLKRLGVIHLNGQVSSTKSMVSTNSIITSQLGKAILDVKLTNLNSAGDETYEGNMHFKAFELGELLNNPQLGKASFSFKVKGQGFRSSTIDTHLNGRFTSLEFNGYTYHNIDVLGEFDNPIFNGRLISHDPNLKMEFNGMADVSGLRNNYDFTAKVSYADLNTLNFVKNDTVAVFKGEMDIEMHGHNINDVEGVISLSNASYENRKGVYDFDKLTLKSTFNGAIRKITINSPDIINGQMKGHYVLTQVPALFRNTIGDLYSNYQPIAIDKNQFIHFDIAIHNKIVEALFPEVTLGANTFIRGKVKSSNSNLELFFKSPKIRFKNNTLYNVDLKLDNTNPLYSTYFDVDSITTPYYDFSKVHLISKRKNDTLFVRTQFKGGHLNKDEFNLNFFHTIDSTKNSVVGIRRSNIKFKEATWLINAERADQTLVFDRHFDHVKLDTLVVSHQDERISLSGIMRGDNYKDFELEFSNVDLSKVTPTIKKLTLGGILNGTLAINQRRGFYYPSSNLEINNFQINAIDYGDLTMNIQGNRSLTSYQVNAKMVGPEYDYMTTHGQINVGKNPSIDLDVNLDKFKIGILNSLGNGIISNIRGTASGYAHVAGSYRRPTITGELFLDHAGIKIPYLNVDMAFENHASVKLSGQQFYFDHIDFEDTKYHTKGQLDGTMSHHNFRDWKMDLSLDAPERLLVLDTDFTLESLYYGTAFISGNARISGPFDELVIDVTASSEKGTVFKIPLSDAESIGNNEFIYFLTPQDKKARKAGKTIVFKKLKGLELNFDLDVTRDALVAIEVDRKSGSVLRGRGAGTLLVEINTNGKFNMWGDFVVYQGTYDFHYAGLIEKQFQVVPGGSITWDGSPIQANLNVKALYEAQANPASLLRNPTINRSIPVNVYIDLNGMLTSVDINFELDYPNLSSVVKSELEYRISDRKTTEIQALSLITQGSFYNPGLGGNAHPENLLYERAANLFDDIFSGNQNKFEVGVNYTKGNRTPDQDIADRVGVTLSTNISDRILINGRVGVPIGGYTRSVVVGNVQIEFLLNEDGTLRANVFNRESDIQYIGEELGYTQGVGLSYSVDFDTFKELIHKILNKKVRVEEIPNAIKKDEKESIVPDYIQFP